MASWYQSLASRGRPSAARIWQPRNTSSVIFSKGLLNAPGENNCFLNSAVQVLWHLDVFRRSFREMGGHACMGKACIFCALKVLFTQLQYSEQQSLPPDALRKALAVAFQDEHRFQLGFMDDAAECFENILTRIHFHLAHSIKEELCDAKHCISHQKFAMTLIEHSVCTCGATSEPFPFTQMVHYVSCTALCAEAKKLKEKYRWSSSVCFGQVLRNAGAIGDIRDCPSECGKKINIRRVLMNSPDVVSIGLVWDSDRPEKEHIVDVIQCLGTSLRMPDLFNAVIDEKAKQAVLHMVGVVTYYGKHYSTFFYNTALRVWVYFDDATVKQVGPNWRDVVSRCKRGHSQPLLLLFANPNGSPVPTETAPQESTLLPGYAQNKNLTGTKPPRQRVDSISSGNSLHCSALQAVTEYGPDCENQRKTFPDQNGQRKNGEQYVVEIGHDALRTIQARHSSDSNASQNSHLPIRRDCSSFYHTRQTGSSRTSGNDLSNKSKVYGADTHGVLPVSANQLALKRTAYSAEASPYSDNTDTTHCKTKENCGIPTNTLQKDTNENPLHFHCNDEAHLSLLNPRGLPQPGINNSANVFSLNTNSDKVFHPRRLERHESWSGRPCQPYVFKSNPLRQCTETKHSVQRHNSFSQRSSLKSQPQDKPLSLGCKVPRHGIHQSQPVSEYSANEQSMPQFGSVPNLHRDLYSKSGKSSSMQNITLAEEGILANAIQNSIQQKRTSTSDMPSSSESSNASCNSQLVTSGIMSGNESMLGLTDLQDCHFVTTDIKTQPTKQNAPPRCNPPEGCNQMSCQNELQVKCKGKDIYVNRNDELIHTQYLMDDSHSCFNPSFYKRTARNASPQMYNCNPTIGCYGLRDRDSVASKDSGYRSRDRSSASSGSVYSVESSPLGLNGLQDTETVCYKVCAECDDIEAKSRRMGDAGDLATALALCTSSVTKLKECLQLKAICSQTRQLLHNRYNKAVLQSRNLHRRMTLLRKQDSFHLGHHQQSPDIQHQPSISHSQLPGPTKENSIKLLQGSTVETNCLDRLKQQLHGLYLQQPSTKVANKLTETRQPVSDSQDCRQLGLYPESYQTFGRNKDVTTEQ